MSPIEVLKRANHAPRVAEPEPVFDEPWSVDQGVLVPRDELTDEQKRKIERLAFQFGEAPESYDIVVSESHVLFTPCGGGAISVLPDRKYWHVPGGILAPEELKPKVCKWLKEVSAAHKKTILMYSLNPRLMPLFREVGWEVNMLGIEPIMELGDVDWKGSKLSWVRRQTSYCKRQGLEVVEITDLDEQTAIASELIEILMEDLAGRTFPKPLRLLEGEFDPHRLERRRLFVARHAETKAICGFLASNPLLGGTEWAFETYRKRDDAPRGTIAFLFREVIDQLQSEGAKRVTLCLVPGKHANDPELMEGPKLVRFVMSSWYNHLSFMFNIRGQDYFKQRFRPTDQPRYTCVSTVSSPGTLFSFLKTTGATFPHPWNLTKNIWHAIRSKFRK